jgi:N-methylhydantoinase A
MANAIRLLGADRGIDYRSLDLMAFGGAGPLHAALIGRRLGLRRVVIPPQPGLASAFGALVADLRVDRRVTRSMRSDIATAAELRATLAELAADALNALHEEGEAKAPLVSVGAGCRYLGQNYEQEVALALDDESDLMDELVERFHRQHESIYGYRLPNAPVEIVYLTATAVDTGRPRPAGAESPALPPAGAVESATRPVYLKDEGWVETDVVRRGSLPPGTSLAGPLVIEEHDSTVLVLSGQQVTVHASGALVLELAAGIGDGGEAREVGARVG